jgi:hypothetical protein
MSGSTVVFPDGSTIENGEEQIQSIGGEQAMDAYRFRSLIVMLNMEINTKMKMSRHVTALQAAERMADQKFGRGESGRLKALQWAREQFAALMGEAIILDENGVTTNGA